jgi:hypothetical protein
MNPRSTSQRTCSQQGPLTAVGEHKVNEGHNITAREATVLARENNFWGRKISEAINIRE